MDSPLLQQFAVSRNGFLPAGLPLDKLPDPYYAPWELIIADLPTLLKEDRLRDQVAKLGVLSTDHLHSEAEWRRAYVILSFLTHGYIWGGHKVVDVLPPCITIPYLTTSTHLELPPVATYAALNLWNFTTDKTSFADLDSLKALHTFTGTESESWFYVVSTAMECRGAQIIPIMLRAIDAVREKDYKTVTAALREFIACIDNVGRILERMYERCDPNVFFFQIRPFLAGSKNMADKGLPRGVFYDEGNGQGSWREYRGGSNGQSSLIQFFDIVLSVHHRSDGEFANPHNKTGAAAVAGSAPGAAGSGGPPARAEKSFHNEVRSYMPGPHHRFLQHVADVANIQECAGEATSSDPEHQALLAAFQDATAAMAAFRNKHLAVVTRYIVIPSRAAQRPEAALPASHAFRSNEAKGGAAGLTGTGGTALLPFLKQSRDETLHAGHVAAEQAAHQQAPPLSSLPLQAHHTGQVPGQAERIAVGGH